MVSTHLNVEHLNVEFDDIEIGENLWCSGKAHRTVEYEYERPRVGKSVEDSYDGWAGEPTYGEVVVDEITYCDNEGMEVRVEDVPDVLVCVLYDYLDSCLTW